MFRYVKKSQMQNKKKKKKKKMRTKKEADIGGIRFYLEDTTSSKQKQYNNDNSDSEQRLYQNVCDSSVELRIVSLLNKMRYAHYLNIIGR